MGPCALENRAHLLGMEFKSINTGNWITRKVSKGALCSALVSVMFVIIGTFLFWSGKLQANELMPASYYFVFKEGEYWRLWSALFAHADIPHLFGNLFLFFPFAYYLSGYFGFFFFPLIGFFMGGVTNFFVLQMMPEKVSLIGASGVVHWMGAAWMTLAFLIDRREKIGKRLIKSIGISMILFLPDVYKPEISYTSHFIGYAFGVLSGVFFYYRFKDKFLKAEVIEYVPVEEVDFDWGDPSLQGSQTQDQSQSHLHQNNMPE